MEPETYMSQHSPHPFRWLIVFAGDVNNCDFTLMPNVQKLEKASLNKLIGEGFAEVVQDEDDIRQCTGMIRFDEEVPPELVASFDDRVAVEFSGTVYDHHRDETSVETFPVTITEIESEAAHPTVRFSAEEDPYIDREPARRL